MTKKSLADKLKQATTAQRQDKKDRFKSADDVLLRGIRAGEKKRQASFYQKTTSLFTLQRPAMI